MIKRPPATRGLHHVALWVTQFEACEYFYTVLLGMQVEWRPDPDNLYLTSGNDNLALHRAPAGFVLAPQQRLDHLGFILATPADVLAWHTFLLEQHVTIKTAPRAHRDGAHSFYCSDPDGNIIQMIYHPPLAKPDDSR